MEANWRTSDTILQNEDLICALRDGGVILESSDPSGGDELDTLPPMYEDATGVGSSRSARDAAHDGRPSSSPSSSAPGEFQLLSKQLTFGC